MYKIKKRQRENAKEEGVIIRPSTRKFKKIDVFDMKNNKLASIGDIRYKDFAIYLKELPKEEALKKRNAYLKRHSKEPKIKNGKRTPSYYSDRILWN